MIYVFALKISGRLGIDLKLFFDINLQITKPLLRYLKRKFGVFVKVAKIVGNPFNCYVTEWRKKDRRTGVLKFMTIFL